MRTRILVLVLVLGLPVAALAAPTPEDCRTVASPPGLAAGDHDAALAALADVIARDPESALVPAALLRMQDLRGFARDEGAVTDRLLAVVEKGVANGENDELLRRYLRERLRERGEFERADALAPDRGYVLHWAVLGPFGFGARSLLDERYRPEEVIDFQKGYADLAETRRFLRLPLDDDRTVDPFDLLEGNGDVAYSVAQVKADAARPALLAVTTGGSVRVWLNGAEVLRIDRLHDRSGRTHAAVVALAAGWNRIVVKGAGRGAAFSLKLSDPETGRPLKLAEEENLVLHDAVPSAGPAEPRETAYLPDVDGPAAEAVRGLRLEDEGLDLEALEHVKAAVEALPDDAGLRVLLADQYRGANGLPEVWRKNRARIEYGAALEKAPGCSPAVVALAELDHADDRSEEAAKSLRAHLAENPDDLAARWTLSRVAAGKNWEKEALAAARACLEICPRFRPALAYLADHEEKYGDVAEARKLLETTVGYWRDDYSALRNLARFEAAAGDVEAAIARYEEIGRLWPRYTGSRSEIAGLLADLGRYDEAIGMLRTIAVERPTNAWYPRRIGDLLRQKGDVAGAVAAYRESLELRPSQADLRRYVERLSDEETDFSRPYETEVLDLIPGAPGREDFPRAPAVCLLDQTILRVWPDGSSTSVVHMAYKLLDEKGVEAFGRVQTGGETLEVRTIDPDGKIWEPIGVTGTSYNMPALAPGAVVEYRYRADAGSSDRSFDTGPFYFADPDYANAVKLSRWVVILPKDLECDLLLRNFEGEHETKEVGDTIVHEFTVRDSDRTEQEPFMPDRDSLLPWARFLRNRPFADAGRMQEDRLWAGIAPTPLVIETAREVAGAAEGDVAKARALFAWVNETVTGSFSFGGPTATILEKAGDRFDLLASLLTAAGVDFEMGVAATDHGRNVDWDVPTGGEFRHRFLRLPPAEGAEPVWIFDAPRYAAFGRIPDDCRDSPAIVIGRATPPRIETVPPERDSLHENRTEAEISLGAGLADSKGKLRLEFRADGGASFKGRVRDLDADERRQQIERWVGGSFTGPVLEEHAYPGLDDYGTPAVLQAVAKLPNFLQPEGKGAKCGLGIRPLNLANSYVGKPTRIHPMEIGTDFGQEDRAVIDLGGKWRVKSLPADHVTVGPLGVYSLTVREEGGKIVVTRRVRFRPVDLSKDEYPALVSWVKSIDEAEGRKILLENRSE